MHQQFNTSTLIITPHWCRAKFCINKKSISTIPLTVSSTFRNFKVENALYHKLAVVGNDIPLSPVAL